MTTSSRQGYVFGIPVAGTTPSNMASFIKIAQSGPAILTGGAFGSDGGLLVTLAFSLGMIPVLLYVRFRYGKFALYTLMAEYKRENISEEQNASIHTQTQDASVRAKTQL